MSGIVFGKLALVTGKKKMIFHGKFLQLKSTKNGNIAKP